ncbi:uncharacterized protein LOC135827918 [Sycon ciliatum]|uniref:uncharacterized protein LOC135827918 n=1 Tax=Sycon ciliatum TaxID=27933 RepID=UPI0031F6370B
MANRARRATILSSSEEDDDEVAAGHGHTPDADGNKRQARRQVLASSSSDEAGGVSGTASKQRMAKANVRTMASSSSSSSSADSEELPTIARSTIVSPSTPSDGRIRPSTDFETRTTPSRIVGDFTRVHNRYCREKGEEYQDSYGGYDSFLDDGDGSASSSDSSSTGSGDGHGTSDDGAALDLTAPVANNTRSSRRRSKVTPRSQALRALTERRRSTRGQPTNQASRHGDGAATTAPAETTTPEAGSPIASARSLRGDEAAGCPADGITSPVSRRSMRSDHTSPVAVPATRRSRKRPAPSSSSSSSSARASPASASSSSSSSESSPSPQRRRRSVTSGAGGYGSSKRSRRRVAGSSSEEDDDGDTSPVAMDTTNRRVSARSQKLLEAKRSRQHDRFAPLLSSKRRHDNSTIAASNATGGTEASSGLAAAGQPSSTTQSRNDASSTSAAAARPRRVRLDVGDSGDSSAGNGGNADDDDDDFVASTQHTSTRRARRTTAPRERNDSVDIIASDDDDEEEADARATYTAVFGEFPSQPGQDRPPANQVWNTSLNSGSQKRAMAWQPKDRTKIEVTSSSSDNNTGGKNAGLEISGDDEYNSDKDFIVSDDEDEIEDPEDNPPPVDLVMDRAFLASLRTDAPARSARKRAGAAKQVSGSVRRTKAKPPPRSRHRARTRQLNLREAVGDDTSAIREDWSDDDEQAAVREEPVPTVQVSEFYTAMSRTSLEGMQSLCRRMLRITERTPVQRVGQRLGRLRHVGLSPLHAAVRAQRPDIVAWLLDLCLDPLTLSSVEKAPAILFSRDVQCLRLLCKCCTVDERPLLTDAQSAKLLKRVLEWPHAIRAHCQQDGVVSKGADADADDGSGAGCGERTDATCDLWPVEQEPGPGRVDSSSAESLSDAPSFRDWCACCSLTLMQDQCGVRMSETAAAGLRVLAECFKPVWSKHPEAVSVACSAANINCLKYLLAEKASTLFVNKNDRTNCYHLAVLAESFQLNGTSDLLSSAYKVQHRTMGGHGNSSGGHGDSSGGRGDSAGSHGDDGDAAVGEQQAWPDLFGADMVQGVTDAYADVAAAHCIKLLWKQKAPGVDAADVDGFTPLMRACAAGRVHCVLALLECGASVCERDLLGVSPLHMAAAVGHLHCIQALLHHGHRVDCVDNQDWPPLMYANFSASERCVVELMKAKPEQLSLLGRLLRKPYECEDLREKTQTVICSILTALGNHDRYYSLFNEFVRGNIDLLDDDAYAFASRSTGLLDLPNKRLWLERRLQSLREYVPRKRVALLSVVWNVHSYYADGFIGLLNGGSVVGSPQATASAGIVAMHTDTNLNLYYTGRISNISEASFGSMQMSFSDGPQLLMANTTAAHGNFALSTTQLNELYTSRTSIDVRPPPSNSTGFTPSLLAGRVVRFGPLQDLENYLRGMTTLTGQLNLAITPAFCQSPNSSSCQGQGGLLQLRYNQTSLRLTISLYVGGLANGIEQCGFWSSGKLIIDLMPLVGKGVYAGSVFRTINVYLSRQQQDLFKDNKVEFRTYSLSHSNTLGQFGSLVYNEVVHLVSRQALAITVKIEENTPNVFVAIIPDNFMFRAPGFLTYKFSSGDTINNISVFTTYPNGTLYTGINGSYVPDYEIASVMNVELDLYVNNQFHTQLNVTVDILDINDNYPVFTSASNVTVNEDIGLVPDSAVITTIEVSDSDITAIYGLPLVSILNATNEIGKDRTSYFSLSQSKAGGPASINRTKVLDYESPGDRWFRLELQAIDGTPQDNNRKSSVTTIFISLKDLNDNRPMFDQKFYTAKVEKTLAVGLVILSIAATDADSLLNSQLACSVATTDGSPPHLFAVSTVRVGSRYVCELKRNATLELETRRHYNLSLTAIDMGRPMLSQSVPVHVQVVDEPFKLVVQFPPPFLTVYNSSFFISSLGNTANFSFTTNNANSMSSVAFECRIIQSQQACRYRRAAISACSKTCGQGTRTVTLVGQSHGPPVTDPACTFKIITEPCQINPCPGSSSSSTPVSSHQGMIPCGVDLYCEDLDQYSDIGSNKTEFVPCITGAGPTAPTGTYTQSNLAAGNYAFQLRALVNITLPATGDSFTGYSNTSLLFTVDSNECTARTHGCHANANCSNILGSYTCACSTGYQGNGTHCSG